MLSLLRPAVVILAVLTLLTGVVYPLAVTGIAALLFPHQAGGSVLEAGGRAVGSRLIGQPFSEARYFWPRPSATGPFPQNPAAATGSNLAATNPVLAEQVARRYAALRAADPLNPLPVPVELLTTSASGLDPHLSPAGAEFQVSRVARARGMSEQAVREAVARHTQGRTLGLLGEPRVNVLLLNLDLDGLLPPGEAAPRTAGAGH